DVDDLRDSAALPLQQSAKCVTEHVGAQVTQMRNRVHRRATRVHANPARACVKLRQLASQRVEQPHWRARAPGGDDHYYGVPSTSTRLPVEARWRIAIGAAYSSDACQRRACSALGNSITTRRRGCQSPSSVSWPPPRTTNRPPCGSSVAGTSAPYSRYASWS